MTTIKSFDYLNRLTLITNAVGGIDNPAFNYAHNAANQRTAITNADGSRWTYEYDTLGQVTSGKKQWSDGTAVLGQQFEYTFDDIGNRKTAVSGGDANGTHKRTQYYTASSLNQYSQRTVPGYLDILGTSTNTATVTVNNGSTSRKGDYYRREVSVPNSGAVWQNITNVALLASGTNDIVTNVIGNIFIPKTPELFGYDADGNQTNDGRWALTWDAENRLIKMQSLAGAPIGSSNRLTFIYDQQGRRISKTIEAFLGGAWSITLSNRFIYDGWNLIAEINATNDAVINSYVWGLDLSGSIQGAGGVGGLLFVSATNAGTHFYGYDGNGNVTVLVSATSGAATANYEYDPFGNLLRATGPLASLNPFRFSTKFDDGESGLLYYGYRYFNGTLGKWLSRDPLGERTFFWTAWAISSVDDRFELEERQHRFDSEAYSFARNSGISWIDVNGGRVTPGGDIDITPKNRRDPPNGMELVEVSKCTILIVYGHNWRADFDKKGLQWIWNIVPKDDKQPKNCAFAAIVGCYGNDVPNEIPLPGYTPVNALFPAQDPSADTDLDREGGKAVQAAEAAAKVCCKNNACGCKEIKIEVKSYGLSLKELMLFPRPQSKTIKCGK